MNILIVIAVIHEHKSCRFIAPWSAAAAIGGESFISVTHMWSVEFQNNNNEVGGDFFWLGALIRKLVSRPGRQCGQKPNEHYHPVFNSLDLAGAFVFEASDENKRSCL